MDKKDNKIIPHISGIGALYYFAQSGGGYDRYYEDIINQIEDKRASFASHNYAYDDNDIIITINSIDLKYSGMGRDGFLWFNHDFFRVGFKDSEKSVNIQNIRVQLNAIGIYTLGITSLLEYINKKLLDGALLSTNYFPVTRIDVNMFIEHNFNYLTKEMILSKKKTHSANIGERSSGYELETYYVGKKPFMLRIYNKLKELENASEIKREIMYNYFGINGLDVQKSIFNVEFEFHREFLKLYDIDTIEDALSSAKRLFELGCDLVKVLDVSALTDEQINSSNRKRAPLNPVWEYISTHYDNKEFMQIETPLEKIERISYRYSLEDARKPIKRQITRLLLHGNSPTLLYFYELLQSAKDDYENRVAIKKVHDENISADSEKSSSAVINEYQSFADDLKTYSDIGLLNFEEKLSKEMNSLSVTDKLYDELLHKYNAMTDELKMKPYQVSVLGWWIMEINFEALKLLPQMYALIEKLNAQLEDAHTKRWLSVKELAEYLSYSSDRVYKIKDEQLIEGIHFFKKSGKILFDRVAIDSWVWEGNTHETNITQRQIVDNVLSSIREI